MWYYTQYTLNLPPNTASVQNALSLTCGETCLEQDAPNASTKTNYNPKEQRSPPVKHEVATLVGGI